MRIERERFSAGLSARPINLASPEIRSALREAGIDPAQLGSIGNGDQVIAGEAELRQLYERLGELDRRAPLGAGEDLGRATRLFRALNPDAPEFRPAPPPDSAAGTGIGARRRTTRELPAVPADSPPPQPAAAPVVAAPVVAAPVAAETGTPRAPGDPLSTEARARVTLLRDLPPVPAVRGERSHPAVSAYLDAMAARQSGATRPPPGVSTELWNLSRALPMVGLSQTDVEHYLATGTLPDLVDSSGTVTKTGAQRFEELEQAATRRGSWPAVNSFTYLVGMRRSAMAAERAEGQTRLDAMAADDPRRAELSQAIDQSRTLDRELHRGLQGIYSAATYARERNGQAALLQAGRYEDQARAARERGDTTRATELDARAAAARDRAAQIAHSEATYRAGMRGTGWSAVSTFQLAAEAQISRGRAEVDALVSSTGTLPQTPPASLGMTADAGNGVPGAGRLLADARAADPNGGNDHRTFALEGQRQGAIASFHRAHLERGGYFAAIPPSGPLPADRSTAILGHREAYLEARASQADAAGGRLELYAAQGPLSPQDALTATTLAAERRGTIDEIEGTLGRSLASDRQGIAARERYTAASGAVDDARTAEGDARTGRTQANEGVGRARDQREAVFGDTFKTSGEARRDNEGVSDAEVVANMDRDRATFATRRREGAEATLRAAGDDVNRTDARVSRDFQDASIARGVLSRHRSLAPGGTGTIETAYTSARAESDRLATLGGRYLTAAQAGPPPPDPAARRIFELTAAGSHLDLAQYWTSSAELDAQALGDPGRSGATVRLDRSATHITAADTVRARLPADDPLRPRLALGVIEARSSLAEANADYRPDVSRTQLASAERVMGSDLANSPDLARTARGRIGSAAVTSLVRHDQRFDEVLRGGGYVATTDDALYRQAHRMLDNGGGGNTPEIRGARELLGRVDRALDRAGDMLSASGDQLRNGQEYAEARTRSLGRSEISAAQAQVSVVISGGAYLLSFGQFDMREEMADAGEGATRHRLNGARNDTAQLTHGQSQLSTAWSTARGEGRAFEFIGSLRIFSDRANAERYPDQYNAAFMFLDSRVSRGGGRFGASSDSDWQSFNRVAIRGDGGLPPAVPVARALIGPVLGYEGAMEALGDRRIGVITGSMRDMMQDQAASLNETTRNMGLIIAVNTGLEVALGIVLTGGLGSAAAVGEAANVANTARTGLQAANAVRTVGMLGRAGQAITAFRAAYPVLNAIGTTAVVGAGMMGVSHGARRLFGASSGASRFVDMAANFIPIGAGQRAMRMGQGVDAALVRQMERAALHGRLFNAGMGGAQAFGTAIATPWIAQRLNVTSDTGQAAIGLALNLVFSGGVAYGTARRAPARAQAEAITPHLVEGTGVNDPVRGRVRGDVESFLRRTEGRVPTDAESTGLRRQLYERLGISETGGDSAMQARRQRVDASVEAIRIDRAGTLGIREAQGRSREPLTADQATRAVELVAARLYEARGGDAGGASRSQAYRDALDVTVRRLGDSAPETLVAANRAAVDRARAGELAADVAPANRARVETILSEEIGPRRQAIERGESSSFDTLAGRLEREGGLSRTDAQAIARAAQQDAVLRGGVGRVTAEQARSTTPLSDARIRELLAESGENAGLRPNEASTAASDLASRAGFGDWVRSQLPARHWTPDMHRENFLNHAHADARAELSTLNTAEFNAIYGNSAVPSRGLDVVGRIPGFAAFARAHPAEARVLADAAIMFGGVDAHVRMNVTASGPAGFRNAAAHWQSRLPVVTPHPTNPNYSIVTRGPNSPDWIPAYQLRPNQALDGNGAFHYGSNAGGRVYGDRRVATPFADLVNVPRPDQMIVGGNPLPNADNVVVFSGHGFWYSAGESTSRGSAMAADQIIAARRSGQAVDYVVLDACHQRDRRWFFGGSNAEAFQRQTNAALAARGEPPITVLAADRGGATYGTSQRSWLPIHRDNAGKVQFSYRYDPTRYVEANQGGRFYMDPMMGVATASVLGTAALGGFIVYRALSDRPEQPRPEETRPAR